MPPRSGGNRAKSTLGRAALEPTVGEQRERRHSSQTTMTTTTGIVAPVRWSPNHGTADAAAPAPAWMASTASTPSTRACSTRRTGQKSEKPPCRSLRRRSRGSPADWRGEEELPRAEDKQSDDGHEHHQIDDPAVAG